MGGDAVAEIKARLDIIDVVGAYVRLTRSGRSHKGLCPFHSERTPSFHVDQDRQAFYCFGCQEGGDVFTFIERIERVDFRQALQLLAERAGVELEERSGRQRDTARRRRRALELSTVAQAFYEYVLWSTPVGATGRALLAERHVPEDLARRFGIGFAPAGGQRGDALTEYIVKRGHGTAEEAAEAGLAYPPQRGPARDRFRHRLVFPIRDERGQVLGFGGRAIGDAVPKYLNTPATDAYDKSTAVFGIDVARPAIAEAGRVLLVEGYFDVVASYAAGVRFAVAASGTALTAPQVRLLARHARTVVLCFDGDEAGTAAARRAVDLVAAEGLEGRICVLPSGYKDPDELVRADPDAFVRCVRDAGREWQVLLDRALGTAEGGSVDQRRGGAERAVALLARIPEATTRELYTQQAARRLEVNDASMAADVGRVVAHNQGAQQRPQRLVVSLPAVTAPAAVAEARVEESRPLSSWERHIGGLVLLRPELAARLVEVHGLRAEEIVSPTLRRILEVARGADPGVAMALHRLDPADRALAAGLLLRSLPELVEPADPELVDRVLADCALRVREAAVELAIEGVQRDRRRARDGGRAAEAEELAMRLGPLYEELQRCRNPGVTTAG